MIIDSQKIKIKAAWDEIRINFSGIFHDRPFRTNDAS